MVVSSRRTWTVAEDEAIRKAVKTYGTEDWHQIAAALTDRTHTQCYQRWTKYLAPGLIKGAWTDSEDELLLRLVYEQLHCCLVQATSGTKQRNIGKFPTHVLETALACTGPTHPGFSSLVKCSTDTKMRWPRISGQIPGRTPKQCRERWVNNLNPLIIRGKWTAAEDQIIANLFEAHPKKWALIAKALPGRTENTVKNRCKTLINRGICTLPPTVKPIVKRKRTQLKSEENAVSTETITNKVNLTLQLPRTDSKRIKLACEDHGDGASYCSASTGPREDYDEFEALDYISPAAPVTPVSQQTFPQHPTLPSYYDIGAQQLVFDNMWFGLEELLPSESHDFEQVLVL